MKKYSALIILMILAIPSSTIAGRLNIRGEKQIQGPTQLTFKTKRQLRRAQVPLIPLSHCIQNGQLVLSYPLSVDSKQDAWGYYDTRTDAPTLILFPEFFRQSEETLSLFVQAKLATKIRIQNINGSTVNHNELSPGLSLFLSQSDRHIKSIYINGSHIGYDFDDNGQLQLCALMMPKALSHPEDASSKGGTQLEETMDLDSELEPEEDQLPLSPLAQETTPDFVREKKNFRNLSNQFKDQLHVTQKQ
jgi:hypothetical protein